MDDGDRRSESSSFYGDSDDDEDDDDSILLSSSSTSSDLADGVDATSSSPSSSSLSSNASQVDQNRSSFDLSSLVAELPVKRGLSRYFDGKSESFRSLSEVRCVGDLVKKETAPSRKRLKVSVDYACGFDSTQKRRNKQRFHGSTISKKSPKKGSSVFWQARRNRNGGLPSSKMGSLPLH